MEKSKKISSSGLRSKLATLRYKLYQLEMGNNNISQELQILKQIRKLEQVLDSKTRRIK